MKRLALFSTSAVMSLGLVLTGCVGAGGGEGSGGEENQDTQQQQPVDDPGVVSVDPSDIIIEQTYTKAGTQDSTKVSVLSLQEEGDFMTLRIAFTPTFASVADDEYIDNWDLTQQLDMSAFESDIVLLDRQNLKEYSVIRGEPGAMASSTGDVEILNGSTWVWWGTFAKPQDEVATLDLRVSDMMPEFTDIPITR